MIDFFKKPAPKNSESESSESTVFKSIIFITNAIKQGLRKIRNYFFRGSIFRKNFCLYFLITLISFSVLAIGFTQAYRTYYYKYTEGLLLNQAKKIEDVYISSHKGNDFKLDYGSFAKRIDMLDKYIDFPFILIDSDRKILWRSSEIKSSDNLGNTMLNTRYISSIFKGKTVTFSDGPNDLFDDAMYTMGYPVTVNGKVIAAIFVNTPVTVMLSAIHVAYQIIFLITFLTTTIAFVLIYYSSKKSVLPILQLSEMAKVIADGNFEKRIEVNMGGEVAQLAESFNNMAEVLDKKSKLRRDYMLNISHDLRSPLTSILGFLQAIIDGTVPPEKVNYYLKIIYSETERLSKLTNNILDLDTIESGGEKLNITQFDIVQLITDTLMKLEKRIGDKNIDVDFTISSGEIFVSADKEKIERVIYNLLDNALKFLSENGKLILDVNSDGKKAHISIADNGIGMTEEEQKRAFERFYKADSSRGKDKKGSGLGLPIVQVLLKAHNETITLESEKDKGTKFSFSLPIAGDEM